MKANCSRCKREFDNDLELLLSFEDPSQAMAKMAKGEYTQKQINTAMKKCQKLCPGCREEARDRYTPRYNPPEGEMLADGFEMLGGVGPREDRISEPYEEPTKTVMKEPGRTLEDYGFVRVGSWKLCPVAINGIDFKLASSKLKNQRVFYVFTVNDTVKYIEICPESNTTLALEMKTYEHAREDNTYKVIAGKIKACLDKGQTVRIQAADPDALCHAESLDADLIRTLKKHLSKEFQPEWNDHT